MKKFLLILSLFLTSSVFIFAQDDDDDNGNEKVRDKMSEYIQKKLDLSDAETKKFAPVFIQYFKEWRSTLRDNKGPENRLQRQQKMVELRLKFKPQFQQILGDRRGLKVYDHMDIFINELRELRQNRIRNGPVRGRG